MTLRTEMLVRTFILLLLPSIVSGMTLDHANAGTVDITSIFIPVSTEQALLNGNAFGDHANGIPVNYFTNLPDLWKLNLHSNKLDEDDLPGFVFSGIGSSLTWLFLQYNELTVVRADLLKALEVLERLYLNGNKITVIEQGK